MCDLRAHGCAADEHTGARSLDNPLYTEGVGNEKPFCGRYVEEETTELLFCLSLCLQLKFSGD